jgi:hypothetical protein
LHLTSHILYKKRARHTNLREKKMTNLAAWIPSKGAPLQIGPADIPQPGSGELVIEARLFTISSRPKDRKAANNLLTQNRAVPLHPGDWKLAKGIIPIPLNYPAIIGSTKFLVSHLCILLRCEQIMLLDMSTKSDQESHDSRKVMGF